MLKTITAFFFEDKFICYEDDYDSILKLLNNLHEENKKLKQALENNNILWVKELEPQKE